MVKLIFEILQLILKYLFYYLINHKNIDYNFSMDPFSDYYNQFNHFKDNFQLNLVKIFNYVII